MLTEVLIPLILVLIKAEQQTLLKFLFPLSAWPFRGPAEHTPTFSISTSVKSLIPLALLLHRQRLPYFCANHAPVTIESFSLSCPKNCGLSAMATTAFCTVLLVTSEGRRISSLASICLVHDIPNTDVAGPVEQASRRRVK